jgi:hypothetical protein
LTWNLFSSTHPSFLNNQAINWYEFFTTWLVMPPNEWAPLWPDFKTAISGGESLRAGAAGSLSRLPRACCRTYFAGSVAVHPRR